jgi:hypothetical protein
MEINSALNQQLQALRWDQEKEINDKGLPILTMRTRIMIPAKSPPVIALEELNKSGQTNTGFAYIAVTR